jgi:ubiquitin C-terminal hydrolase
MYKSEKEAHQVWDNIQKTILSQMLFSTFAGLFNSTIICPTCNRTSKSFETFNVVSLPI